MTNAQSKYTLDKGTEHELAVWLEEQEDNYHPDISKSKGMLTNPELHKLFTEFVNDPKYSIILSQLCKEKEEEEFWRGWEEAGRPKLRCSKPEEKSTRCSGCGRHDDFCRCGDFMGFGED